MADSPQHPLSVLRGPDGRVVQLNVHGCVWSGAFPQDSLAAMRECLRESVARAEMHFSLLHEQEGGAKLSDIIDVLRAEPSSPTVLELHSLDVEPWPWSRVEQLVRLLEPVRERVVVSGCADWNLRRLAYVDPRLRVGFAPTLYLDWLPPTAIRDDFPGEVGAYGYLDRHPLARTRNQPPSDYLWERISSLVRLAPGVSELHLRLELFERMQSDGLGDTTHRLRRAGIRVGLWTLDAGTPDWQARLNNAVWAGADIITTHTAAQLATARIR